VTYHPIRTTLAAIVARNRRSWTGCTSRKVCRYGLTEVTLSRAMLMTVMSLAAFVGKRLALFSACELAPRKYANVKSGGEAHRSSSKEFAGFLLGDHTSQPLAGAAATASRKRSYHLEFCMLAQRTIEPRHIFAVAPLLLSLLVSFAAAQVIFS
jgi:hypothetical protein